MDDKVIKAKEEAKRRQDFILILFADRFEWPSFANEKYEGRRNISKICNI